MKCLFVFCLLVVGWGCQSKQTVLKGHIENYRGELVRICPEGKSDQRDTVAVDSMGNFVFIPRADAVGIYEISVKDYSPWVSVYLAAGDQAEAVLTLQTDKRIQVVFAGDRTKENQYLWDFDEITNDRMWYTPEMTALSFRAYKEAVDKMDRELQHALSQITDPQVYEQFEEKQHLMFQVQLSAYDWRHSLDDESRESSPDEDYVAYVESIDLNDPKECNKEVLENVIGWYLKRENPVDEKDYMLSYLDLLDRLVSNAAIKNEHATECLLEKFRFFSGVSLDETVERYRMLCSNDSLKQKVDAEYQEYVRVYGNLMPGKTAPDFEMVDEDGKSCRLSDLRGKYLFIDVWATWCLPCRDEIPYMAKLQEHFAGNDRIALISISVDANQKTWRNFLKQEQPTWAQYVVDRENNALLEKEYRIYGIPHFMLLDPEGRIVSLNVARPSEPECVTWLEEVISK